MPYALVLTLPILFQHPILVLLEPCPFKLYVNAIPPANVNIQKCTTSVNWWQKFRTVWITITYSIPKYPVHLDFSFFGCLLNFSTSLNIFFYRPDEAIFSETRRLTSILPCAPLPGWILHFERRLLLSNTEFYVRNWHIFMRRII